MNWNDIKEVKPPVLESCLCIRKGDKMCNLYFDGKKWMDDGYNSAGTKEFEDVTHWIRIKDIQRPNVL